MMGNKKRNHEGKTWQTTKNAFPPVEGKIEKEGRRKQGEGEEKK